MWNQLETNFMGTLNILQLTLPRFRERRAGRYLIFSSTSGALGVPGHGPFCASKYAVEGLIESMFYEVDNVNIKITLVQAGYMRRDEFGDSSSLPPLYSHFLVKAPSPEYSTSTAPAAHALRTMMWIGDKQPSSSAKAAELIWQLGHCSYPPLRLILGKFAMDSVRERMKCMIEEIEDWKHLNFPLENQAGEGL